VLGFFKYFNFFADNLQVFVFDALGWQAVVRHLRVLLPIGISFYTFMTMSYVIDVYRRDSSSRRATCSTSRCSSRSSRSSSPARSSAPRGSCRRSQAPRRDHPRAGARRAVADRSGGTSRRSTSPTISPALANAVFDPDAAPSGVNVLLGVYAFAFQIYGDFAGYSNVARGTSKLMGIELVENFRFPYFVRTAQEFWRHWHISLSTWLRDYLYIPLGGSRGSPIATARTCSSRWCSAACGTAPPGRSCCGAYQGLMLVAYRLGDRLRPVRPGCRARRLARRHVVARDVPRHLLRLADLPRANRRARLAG
jgi:alginate O-acetyltransferase complex protein AlgI